MKTVLTGDLGGTKCRFALLAEDLSVHAARKVDTPEDRATFAKMLDEEFGALLESDLPDGWEPPTAIGIGTAAAASAPEAGAAAGPPLDDAAPSAGLPDFSG